jgi:hypothetical protein
VCIGAEGAGRATRACGVEEGVVRTMVSTAWRCDGPMARTRAVRPACGDRPRSSVRAGAG